MTVWAILVQYHPAFLRGLEVTLKLCSIVWISGLVIGSILGIAGSYYRCSIGITTRGISFVLTGIPLIVFLFWLHYPAQVMLGVVIDPFVTAALVFSIVNVFAVADIVRGALNDFPEQYLVAAKVTGLTRLQTITRIQVPLVLQSVLPGLLLLQVSMLHTSLFASLISVEEIFRVAQRINAQIYRPVEIYTALGLFFLAVCLPVHIVAYWFKRRFTRNWSEK